MCGLSGPCLFSIPTLMDVLGGCTDSRHSLDIETIGIVGGLVWGWS
jgi:hypothetical protein